MDYNTAKTAYGMISPNILVGYNQGVSVDPNGRYDSATGVWHANGREMVWNPRYNQWVIVKGDPNPTDFYAQNRPDTGATTQVVGGGGAPAPVLNQAALNATQKAIDSLATEEEVGLQNIEDDYGSLIGRYDNEATRAKTDYDEQTVSNNQNHQRNQQNALLAAAQGRRGLRSVLSGLGALSGSGSQIADRMVTTAANQDLGGARETAASNAMGLDKALRRFEDEDEDRRKEAETARQNQRTALKGQIASKRQNYYQKMAETYDEGGDTARASDYLGRAGGLNDVIARNTRVAATPFQARKAAFTPGELESYLAGAGDMTVQVGQGGVPGSLNPTSLLAGRGRANGRRREEEEDAPALAV